MLTEVVTHREPISQLIDDILHNGAVWIFLLSVFVIPFLNAALTHVSSSPLAKSVVTAVLAGVTAVVAWITDAGGVVDDWRVALAVFIGTALGAGGINAAIVKGPIADAISNAVPINVAGKVTPEKAAQKHSHGATLTEPVPADHYAQFATDEVPDEYKD